MAGRTSVHKGVTPKGRGGGGKGRGGEKRTIKRGRIPASEPFIQGTRQLRKKKPVRVVQVQEREKIKTGP